MASVRTFKALDHDMRLFGFWPVDLVAVALLFAVAHAFFTSLVVDALTVGPGLLVAWRARKRSPRYGSSLLSFVLTPDSYAVGCGIEEIQK